LFHLNKNKINLSKILLEKTKVPILILDHLWLENFIERATNERVKALETKVLDLLKENANLTEKAKVLQLNKKKYLKEIITLTTEAYDKNNSAAKNKINELRKSILDVNTELHDNVKKIDKLPERLETANRELLEETVNTCYGRVMNGNKRLEALNPEIDTLREELKTLVDEKVALEEEVSKSYLLLHNLVGIEIIEAIDREYEKSGNSKWF